MSSKLFLTGQNTIFLVEVGEIIFCKSDNCYTSLYLLTGKCHVIAKSLTKLNLELSPTEFIRVHQSYLVNKKHIRSIDKKKKIIRLLNDYDIPFSGPLKPLLNSILKVEK